ncbi:MAG: hypothetical protein A3A33_03020 [Candidatus Yanofskybacteria bacterium RIFCSPLOWO2_01_FULL_49_25]|uniref:Uncharacterized protein n=1 Tax=Candidatus Yanofskybacteria bacterium RIFCSPLOWO2_01_FULL_49_25 TaxID=1802701 RepID=A0A1F8GSP0_9BACT|nr:MAG: hypothetical protein A3A33_03020 [Candidatus Yanofskybacteria bacterium RIFCSPLOWO2_01_FULL_49_25]
MTINFEESKVVELHDLLDTLVVTCESSPSQYGTGVDWEAIRRGYDSYRERFLANGHIRELIIAGAVNVTGVEDLRFLRLIALGYALRLWNQSMAENDTLLLLSSPQTCLLCQGKQYILAGQEKLKIRSGRIGHGPMNVPSRSRPIVHNCPRCDGTGIALVESRSS